MTTLEHIQSRHKQAKVQIKTIINVALHQRIIEKGTYDMIEDQLLQIEDNPLSLLTDFKDNTFEVEVCRGSINSKKYSISIKTHPIP